MKSPNANTKNLFLFRYTFLKQSGGFLGAYARLKEVEFKLSVSKKRLSDPMAAKEAKRPLVMIFIKG